MWELVGRAWRGWLEYMWAGKVSALLFLALLLYWVFRPGKERHLRIMRYALTAALLCICPLTAALLWKYQTNFYDYQWIWSLVPMTAAIACGGSLLCDRLLRSDRYTALQKGILITGAIIIILLCGGNDERWKTPDLKEERKKAEAVLAQISGGQEPICLWAPEEIIAHARGLDGSLTLAYGRNMWQEHLNAYSYDTYTQKQREMYVWMEMAGRVGLLDVEIGTHLRVVGEIPPEGTLLKGEEMVRSALALGVNRILLPGNMQREAVAEMEELLQVQAEETEGYYLFRIDGETRSRFAEDSERNGKD